MTRIAIYCRVSTSDQKVDSQLDRLRDYARIRGFEIEGEYIDHGVSGRRPRRPALDEMLGKARRREIDAILVSRLDRIGRDLRHIVNLGHELKELGVDLIALEQAVDTTTSTGRLLFGVLAVLTEFEADTISERAQEGREAARRRGTRLGRAPLLDDEAMKRAQRLHRTGKSHGYIAEQLGVHRTTVLRALRRAS